MVERTANPAPPERPSLEDAQRTRTALVRVLAGKLNCVGDLSLAVAPAVTTDLVSP